VFIVGAYRSGAGVVMLNAFDFCPSLPDLSTAAILYSYVVEPARPLSS